jgi:hypothetical protein
MMNNPNQFIEKNSEIRRLEDWWQETCCPSTSPCQGLLQTW